jgi:ubiquinone/menaquinone biosynthesis C-methylase UbiE
MNWNAIDWNSLERLRAAFLGGKAGATDYWQTENDLASYDATFAQRIGWKWDYVLEELTRRGWSPPAGALLDWGCGSGIASRAFLDQFGPASISQLQLWDRSSLAMQFATKRASEKYQG